jgi:hypothetical protein
VRQDVQSRPKYELLVMHFFKSSILLTIGMSNAYWEAFASRHSPEELGKWVVAK